MPRDDLLLLEPPGPERDRLSALLPPDLGVLDSAGALREASPAEEGVLLLGPGLPPADVLDVIRGWAVPRSGWLVTLVRPVDGGPEIRPLSLGFPTRSEDLLARLADETTDRPVLDLVGVLDAFSRARHDLNNPLTSALAEVQLLLLDVEEPEVREGLETVQRQLERIRDLIQEQGRFRPPPDDDSVS